MYDYLIIGGGISGFYCALELIKHNKNICLCEKYSDLGGRTLTYNKDGYNWEMGAGRISEKHTLLINLMKKYNQPLVSISSDLLYKNGCQIEPNIFESSIHAMFGPLKTLSNETLANSTIKDLCYKIHGKEKTDTYLSRFPYKAEVEILRADLGLKSFYNEMGSHEGYYAAKNGFSSLINAMKEDFISKGGIIFTNYKFINVNVKDTIICDFLIRKSKRSVTLETNKLICAIESENLKKISYFKNLEVLKFIKMEPLLRTYGVFTSGWFSQLPRIVTSNPIRYFLPINYEKNIAMVSYTDSSDTKIFHKVLTKYGEKSLGKCIYNNLTQLFGSLPKMVYFKAHYWKYGASYWLPGKYDPMIESKKSLKPFDCEIYLIGESYSLRQAWIEGALEQVEKLFTTYRL